MLERLKSWAKAVKRDIHALWLAAGHPRTPSYARGLAIGIAAYALSPIDLIPDFIPVLGLLDEAILLPLTAAASSTCLTDVTCWACSPSFKPIFGPCGAFDPWTRNSP